MVTYQKLYRDARSAKYKTQISNFTEICPVGAELFHADGQTDKHDIANSRFSQFFERPKNYKVVTVINWAPHNDDVQQSGGKAPSISNCTLGGRVVSTFASQPLYQARCCRPATGRQHRGCIIPQTVTHSLVLLKMGKIIARNMLSWLELLISRYCCI